VEPPAGAPDGPDAVLDCPDEVGAGDPAEVDAVVPPVPELEFAWPEVVALPGVVEEVDDVDAGPLVAVLVLDWSDGGGDV
jgi:hypothetical protein